jgi:uncharacterized membrane protein YbhN (UPF0104 family)
VSGGPPGGNAARRRALWQWAGGLAVSAGVLAYVFVAHDADPRELWPLVRSISLPGLLLFLAVSTVGLLLRTLRYFVLLEGRAAFWPLVLVTLVRNLFVDLVPARVGGAASYLYLVTARLGLPVDLALASFALAFVLDAVALAPLLLLAALLVGAGPLPLPILIGGSLAVLAAGVAGLWLLGPALGLAARGTARLPGPFGGVARALGGAAREVGRLEARRVLGPALLLSLLLRLAKYGAYYCLLQALLVEAGHPWGSLSFLAVFLSISGAELAASLPVPTIASLGPYEAAGALGFAAWLGLDRKLAALAATAFHGLSQLHDYGLGLLALLWITAAWNRRGRPHPPGGAAPRGCRAP